MYSVSNAYISKLKEVSVKRRRLRGYLDNIAFTEDDVLINTFHYTETAVSSADIKLGGVFVGSLSLTFLSSFVERNHIARGSWRDRQITASIGLFLGLDAQEHEIWEDVPLKPYIIDEANHGSFGVEVKAYDVMSRFDKPISFDTSSGSLYGFASLACTYCGVTFGMTEAEMYELPNGDQILGLYPNNDIETYRDLLSWIAVTIGGFATIDRNGYLVFRTFHSSSDLTIERNNRFTGGSWSDFETKYTAITVSNMADGTISYYAEDPDDGLTLDIGANPFLQYGVDAILEMQRRNILTAIQNLRYVPFKSTSLFDPCLDLGDVITYTDGYAGSSSLCCVMKVDYRYGKGVTLQGYGKNPAMANARSKTDKAVTSAASSAKDQSLTYYTYTNADEKEIGTEYSKLFSVEFATVEQTTVTLWQEIKTLNELDDESQSITYQYYFDGDLIGFEPIDTFGEDGYHTEPHNYWLLDVEEGTAHTWEVYAKVNSGNASIDIGDIKFCMMGQKMVAQDAFKGELEIEDEYTPISASSDIVPITEEFELTLQGEASDRLVTEDMLSYICTEDRQNYIIQED